MAWDQLIRIENIAVIEVDYICETCQRETVQRSEIHQSALGTTEQSVEEKLEQKLAGLASLNNVEAHPCPHCGSYQSWMVEKVKKRAAFHSGMFVCLLVMVSVFALVNEVRHLYLVLWAPLAGFLTGKLVFQFYRPKMLRSRLRGYIPPEIKVYWVKE